MLADAASPVALFTIGAVLCAPRTACEPPTPLRDYLPVALIKLVVHPLMVLALGWAASALGARSTASR